MAQYMPPLGASPSEIHALGPNCALPPLRVECHALAAAGGIRQAWRYGEDRRLVAFWRQGCHLQLLLIRASTRLISYYGS